MNRRYAAWTQMLLELEARHQAPTTAQPERDEIARIMHHRVFDKNDYFIDATETPRDAPPEVGVYEWDLDAVAAANEGLPRVPSTPMSIQDFFRMRWAMPMRGKVLCLLGYTPSGVFIIFTPVAVMRVDQPFVMRWSAVRKPGILPEKVVLEEIPASVQPRPPNYKMRPTYYTELRDSYTGEGFKVLDFFREWAVGVDLGNGTLTWSADLNRYAFDFAELRDDFYRAFRAHDKPRQDALLNSLLLTRFARESAAGAPALDPAQWPARHRVDELPAMTEEPTALIMKYAGTRANFGGIAPARFFANGAA